MDASCKARQGQGFIMSYNDETAKSGSIPGFLTGGHTERSIDSWGWNKRSSSCKRCTMAEDFLAIDLAGAFVRCRRDIMVGESETPPGTGFHDERLHERAFPLHG